jgi:hypothetical protein
MKKLVLLGCAALVLAACSFTVRQIGPDAWRVSLDLPTASPTATATAVPAPTSDGKCWGRVADGPLRVRSGPSLNASILGSVAKGQVLALEAAEQDAQGNGWYRIWWLPDVDGYVWANLITPGEGADCSQIPGPRLGLHLTMIVNEGAIAPLFLRLGTLKATSLNGQLLADAKAANPRIVTIYRSTHVPDCPPDGMDAARWLDQVSRDWTPGADYYEFVNECDFSTARWIDLSIDAMRWAERQGVCLLLFSFAVGHPEIAQWQQLTPVLDYALGHPCQSGRLFGIALHAYTAGSTLDDPWLFSRFRLLYAAIPTQYRALPLYLTEVGDDPQTVGPVDCGRWLVFAREVERSLAGSIVDGYALWSVGAGTGWVDASPCLGAWLEQPR